MMTGKRLALFVSGGGTTAARIMEACRDGELKGLYAPACLVSSRKDAGAIKKALDLGMPIENVHVVDPKTFPTRKAFGERLIEVCEDAGVEIVGQYGWMPKTPKNVVRAYEGRMVNQHPGPLDPGFDDFGGKGMFGMRVHAARLLYLRVCGRVDSAWTEATAQFVHEEFDRGAVIVATRVAIASYDDPYSLQKLVLPVEHATQIAALRLLAFGEAKPIVREERLVPEEDGVHLGLAKTVAGYLFPEG